MKPSRPDLFFADGGVVEDQKRGPFDYRAPALHLGLGQPRSGGHGDSRWRSASTMNQRPAATKPAAPVSLSVKGAPLDSIGAAYGATANKKLRFRGRSSFLRPP